MTAKIKYWLLWIAVFPGAIIMSLLATFPLHWFLLFIANTEDYDIGSIHSFLSFFVNRGNIEMVEYILYPFIIAIIFIFTGYKIAPKYKFKTATVLFGIYLTIWLVGSIIFLFKGGIYGVDAQFSGRTVLALIGAILGLYISKRVDKNKVKN